MRYIFDLEKLKTDTLPEAYQWVEDQFPVKNYGEDILIWEAWGMRYLLTQSFMAGRESLESKLAAKDREIERLKGEVLWHLASQPRRMIIKLENDVTKLNGLLDRALELLYLYDNCSVNEIEQERK